MSKPPSSLIELLLFSTNTSMKVLQQKILLASKSPRRQQLMEEAGFNFEVIKLEVDESHPTGIEKEKIPEFLAHKKASAALPKLKENQIVLAADTVVILEDKILEKPENALVAKQMLQSLSGQWHQVITGVCLLSAEKVTTFSGISKVLLYSLTEEEIDYYVSNYQPFDKAGAYGIQEWIGICKVKRIEGTYANIMGLPMDLVYEQLKQFLII